MSSAFGDLYELKCLFGRKSITKQKFAFFGLSSAAFPLKVPTDCALFLIFSAVITPAAQTECMCNGELYLSTIQFPFPFRFSFDYVLFNFSSCQVIRRLRPGPLSRESPNFSQLSCVTLINYITFYHCSSVLLLSNMLTQLFIVCLMD